MTVPTSSAHAKVNGLEMYYETHGDAPGGGRRLVRLHGGAQTVGLAFSAVLPALAAGRHVVAPELQGHGHTADTDRALTVPDLASDVVALLDELGVQQADFLGFSLGGLTALEIAVRHPERVGRLALAATMYTQDGVHEEVRVPDYSSPRLPSQADFQEMADTYAAVAPDPEHFQDFLAKVSAGGPAPPARAPDAPGGPRGPPPLLLRDR